MARSILLDRSTRLLLAGLLVAAACTDRASPRPSAGGGTEAGDVPVGGAPRAAVGDSAASPAAAGQRGGVPGGRSAQPLDASKPAGSPALRGLYVNRFAAQSSRRLRQHVAWADSTEINALVIDMKDEFGLNYRSANADFRRNEGSGNGVVRDVKALTDTLRAHGIVSIARIVVFKDPVAAANNPAWQIKTPGGASWRDEKGNAWVNAYNRDVWHYNLGVAEELIGLGFDEIQWDYIRFPEPYRRLAPQVFPGADGMKKPDALAAFLREAKARMNARGARSTADIFGLVTTVRGPLEIGQWWEKVAPVTDVLLPMVYPSHYPRGSLGVAHPNAQPYEIIKIAIDTARVRNQKLGITAPEHVRPWLQAFSLYGVDYGAEQVRQQKRAVYDAGYDGWVLWHPGSRYETYIPALERGELVSRKKSP
ncbi:MAG TPA: putative glycoside hydrolase [Gemmatimonadaceae bacterium]|nr:putative glycoside hydrolase [Gemmatimonadaceae bacterium]